MNWIQVILNLIAAIGIFILGGYSVCWIIATYILTTPDAEILAKIKELREEGMKNDN